MCIERTDGNFNHEYILENLLIENEEGGLHSLYKNNKIDLIAYLVHLADISNPSKSYRIYYIWAKRVIAEFLRQGLVESKGREKNIDVLCVVEIKLILKLQMNLLIMKLIKLLVVN